MAARQQFFELHPSEKTTPIMRAAIAIACLLARTRAAVLEVTAGGGTEATVQFTDQSGTAIATLTGTSGGDVLVNGESFNALVAAVAQLQESVAAINASLWTTINAPPPPPPCVGMRMVTTTMHTATPAGYSGCHCTNYMESGTGSYGNHGTAGDCASAQAALDAACLSVSACTGYYGLDPTNANCQYGSICGPGGSPGGSGGAGFIVTGAGAASPTGSCQYAAPRPSLTHTRHCHCKTHLDISLPCNVN